MDAGSSNDYGDADWQQAGQDADAQDLAGPGQHGYLECTVDQPQKEGEGTQNAYVSYLVTTNVSLPSRV
jgi:sorting nexin-4